MCIVTQRPFVKESAHACICTCRPICARTNFKEDLAVLRGVFQICFGFIGSDCQWLEGSHCAIVQVIALNNGIAVFGVLGSIVEKMFGVVCL